MEVFITKSLYLLHESTTLRVMSRVSLHEIYYKGPSCATSCTLVASLVTCRVGFECTCAWDRMAISAVIHFRDMQRLDYSTHRVHFDPVMCFFYTMTRNSYSENYLSCVLCEISALISVRELSACRVVGSRPLGTQRALGSRQSRTPSVRYGL